MYKISITQFFSAAHSLRNYEGKCESLHGHNWKVEVTVSGENLNSAGMIMDFGDLKKLTSKVLDELDHSNLNDLEHFKQRSPSSEEIARYIYTRLKKEISADSCRLEAVKVWETQGSCATYKE